MNIAIVGAGYVGLTTGAALAYVGHKVTYVDVDQAKIDLLKSGKSPIFEPYLEEISALCSSNVIYTTDFDQAIPEADAIFVTVGTPSTPSGRPNLAYVQSAAREIGKRFNGKWQIVVNKSTVPIGSGNWVTTLLREAYQISHNCECPDCFAVASNPEFLREGAAVSESLYPDRIVVGADDPRALETLRKLYQPIVDQSFDAPVLVPRPAGLVGVPLVESDLVSAEMIKYAANSFLALKISFANEVSRLAEKMGADIKAISKGIGLDSRIGPRFLQAGIGWGGSCFGKDTLALITTANEYGIDMPIVKAAREVNYRQRYWVIERLVPELRVLTGRTIGLMGLAFKPDTDDLRDAPAVDIAKWLIERGVIVKAHDPVAMDRFTDEYPDLDIRLCNSIEDLASGVDALVLVTDWPEYKSIDWKSISKLMRVKLALDGRNHLNVHAASEAGVKVIGIGK